MQQLSIRLIRARRQAVLVRRDLDAVLWIHGEVAAQIIDMESGCGAVELGKLGPENGKSLRGGKSE